jgi:hypothetical protein
VTLCFFYPASHLFHSQFFFSTVSTQPPTFSTTTHIVRRSKASDALRHCHMMSYAYVISTLIVSRHRLGWQCVVEKVYRITIDTKTTKKKLRKNRAFPWISTSRCLSNMTMSLGASLKCKSWKTEAEQKKNTLHSTKNKNKKLNYCVPNKTARSLHCSQIVHRHSRTIINLLLRTLEIWCSWEKWQLLRTSLPHKPSQYNIKFFISFST